MTGSGLRIRRAHAQLLYRPAGLDVAGAVRRLVAVQAQDLGAYPLALRARVPGLTVDDVDEAINERAVVRTWGPRGTLHLIAADDLPWLFPLFRTSSAGQAGSARRLRDLGVGAGPGECLAAVDQALAGQGPLTKAELGVRLGESGLPAEGQAIVHLAGLAAKEGLVVLGPARGGKPTYVHTADWLGAPLALETDRESALAELARRYARSHDPAGPRDLAAWSGMPLRDVQKVWQDSAKGGDGPVTGLPPVRLLPGFDEYLLGWADREFAVPREHRATVHPGGGVIRPVLTVAGEVAGTWRFQRAGKRPTITVAPFTGLSSQVTEAVLEEAGEIGGFFGHGAVQTVID